jgi:2-hydroxycyclohexanecarboxyl-CoA dehydrogenase
VNVSSVFGVIGRAGMGQDDTTAAVLGYTRALAVEEASHGRWAEPREIADPILFLACPESSFITATALIVDAGKSASGGAAG